MSPDDIKHFLIVHDIPSAHADVRPYGTDYDAALEAYEQAEQDTRTRFDVEVVLLSSDSLETIKHTHSSYFPAHESFERLLPAGVLRS
ncbi:MAG: hypothetical protein ACHQE6_06585 [Solirubrobacterales bacterium]